MWFAAGRRQTAGPRGEMAAFGGREGEAAERGRGLVSADRQRASIHAPRECPVSVTEGAPNCDIACCTAARAAVADLQSRTAG